MRNGDTLTSSSAATYAWYRNGFATGETEQSILVSLDGRYTVIITDSNGCRAESVPLDVAKPVTIVTTVEIPSLQAAPGEPVRVPIRLTAQNNIAALSPRSFSAELRFNKNLLFPSGGTPQGSIQGAERVIPINGTYTNTQTTLSELLFTAMLGDTDRTALRLANFTWADARASVVTTDGVFLLTVCREGGTRLFDGGARFGVTAHPNPCNASTVIDYTTISSGPVGLFVIDALGRRVATLAETSLEPGAHRTIFDASALASGMYRVLLLSDGMTAGILLMLAK